MPSVTILAAGASSRMGQHKLLMPIAGQTLLQRTVKTALKVSSDVLVVLGRDADLLQNSLKDYPVRFAINHEFANGKMETSLQVAAQALESNSHMLLMLADMPLITSDMLQDMKRAFLVMQPLIVASRYGKEVIAPPHLFSSQLLPLLGQTGAKPLIMQHLEQTVFMDWNKEKLFDVDTPEDVLHLEQVQGLNTF